MAEPVLVVGSIGLDTVETPCGRADGVLGGSAVYFAAAAALFAPVRLVGVVGSDFPASARRRLESRPIDLSGLEEVQGGKTFRWHGRYSQDMNDRVTVSVELNVLGEFRPRLPEAFKKTRWAFLANGPTSTQQSVREQLPRGAFVAADTMDLWIEKERPGLLRLLRDIDCLILNDSEARMLTGRTSLWDAAREALRTGPKSVVVKKGEHGAYLAGRGGPCAVPAFPIAKLVDPTGAGDAFAGGFVGWLAREGSASPGALRRALGAATVVASFACESFGPERLLSARASEVRKRLSALRRLARF